MKRCLSVVVDVGAKERYAELKNNQKIYTNSFDLIVRRPRWLDCIVLGSYFRDDFRGNGIIAVF